MNLLDVEQSQSDSADQHHHDIFLSPPEVDLQRKLVPWKIKRFVSLNWKVNSDNTIYSREGNRSHITIILILFYWN